MSGHYKHRFDVCSTTDKPDVANLSSRGHGKDERNYCRRNDGMACKSKTDDLLTEEMSQGIDIEAAGIGLVVADLFKTVSLAVTHLPNMELYSDVISVVVDDDSITVSITGLNPEQEANNGDSHKKPCRHGCCASDHGCEENDSDSYDDEEEGMIYDGD